jgi:hypothetical protein
MLSRKEFGDVDIKGLKVYLRDNDITKCNKGELDYQIKEDRKKDRYIAFYVEKLKELLTEENGNEDFVKYTALQETAESKDGESNGTLENEI